MNAWKDIQLYIRIIKQQVMVIYTSWRFYYYILYRPLHTEMNGLDSHFKSMLKYILYSTEKLKSRIWVFLPSTLGKVPTTLVKKATHVLSLIKIYFIWLRPDSSISLLSGQRRSNSSHLFFSHSGVWLLFLTTTYISHSLTASLLIVFYLWPRLPANGVYTLSFPSLGGVRTLLIPWSIYSPSISGFSSSLPGIFHVLLPFTTT